MAAIFHKHPRLRDRDYTQGAYFVTLCTKPRRELFGRITGLGKNAMMELNDVGQIVDECWRGIPEHFPHAHLDQTQIMPDHLHAILILAPYFETISFELEEAARIDGCSRFGAFVRIVLPLSTPGLAACGVIMCHHSPCFGFAHPA